MSHETLIAQKDRQYTSAVLEAWLKKQGVAELQADGLYHLAAVRPFTLTSSEPLTNVPLEPIRNSSKSAASLYFEFSR